MSVVSTSDLSSLEAMLNSLMGRSGGGEVTQMDDNDEDGEEEEALESPPPPPPLPVRPTLRGRLPSLPRVPGAAAARPWTPPSPPSPHKGGEEDAAEEVSASVAELERKAAEAEARLRQKEEENAALRRRIESYHIRWLEYEIRIKSLEEDFHEQLASLQMARDAARMAQELPYVDLHEFAERRMIKLPGEEAPPRLRQAGSRRSADGGRRISAVGRLGAEFQRGSQALEEGVAALTVEQKTWQPGFPSADSLGDLRKLKAQFRAWKKDYKARLRKAKAEIDRDRRRHNSCWI
ncbi:hypothetical protein CFC21_087489 [Triticum aestivum]|uniref:Uncharacterized protein n=2 Tax=Triticum aestivum TaxID=4565 RepID=A0A9R1IGQ6_WHEAT|nr:myosin-2-like [Triticum aestivum]KAF7083729.1 hypothetical protein CFC21_087489 [Triticum aestivum]